MYLLKKVIQFREKSHPDHEKPFLEHLEDLRKVVGRVVLTLVIAMLVCFFFNKRLMEFFRRPVDKVLITQLQETLPQDAPRPPTVEMWNQARKVEQAALHLTPADRDAFYKSLNNSELVFHARSISLLRAAMVLPEEKRDGFVNALAEPEEVKLQMQSLLRTKPNTDSDAQGNLRMMSALKPTEGFMLSMKVSFVAGIVISFPLLLFFILQFVLPGLHAHERKLLFPAMAVGFGLFLAGASFAYYMVLPRTLLFFYEWSGGMGISNDWRIGEYISFATQFTLLFGASFELPVVVMVFVKLGLLTYETMSKTRSYAIVAIFVAAAVLTPTPDILTMCIMAAPMIILYEICIWLAYFDRKKARLREEEEARERIESQIARENEIREQDAARISASDPWHDEYSSESGETNEEPVGETTEESTKVSAEEDPEATTEAGDDGWYANYGEDSFSTSDELKPDEELKSEAPEAPENPPTGDTPDQPRPPQP